MCPSPQFEDKKSPQGLSVVSRARPMLSKPALHFRGLEQTGTCQGIGAQEVIGQLSQ